MAKAGNPLYDISKAIQDYAESNGFSVVREMVGHGIWKRDARRTTDTKL